ncbi:MAG: hypothetical protein HY516_00580 [Candidatus Aenigmarchaeota archaeon]|nr:hypothetical protein [Candidatus Aenigmarchaeota archaeon]
MARKSRMKGDITFMSDFFFLIILFFTSLVLMFSMSIAKIIVGNFIKVTVHATFLEFSLNNENSLLSALEIKSSASDAPLKSVLSAAAFQWDGDLGWDGSAYADGKLYDARALSQGVFDSLVQGPYIFELRKEFSNGASTATKRTIVASKNKEKIVSDAEVAEMEFYLPQPACGACSKAAVYRLYSTIK